MSVNFKGMKRRGAYKGKEEHRQNWVEGKIYQTCLQIKLRLRKIGGGRVLPNWSLPRKTSPAGSILGPQKTKGGRRRRKRKSKKESNFAQVRCVKKTSKGYQWPQSLDKDSAVARGVEVAKYKVRRQRQHKGRNRSPRCEQEGSENFRKVGKIRLSRGEETKGQSSPVKSPRGLGQNDTF